MVVDVIGEIDLDAGFELTLGGLLRREPDAAADAHGLLSAAEIAFVAKERAWRAVIDHDGLAVAEALSTVAIPDDLRGALIEIAAAGSVW